MLGIIMKRLIQAFFLLVAIPVNASSLVNGDFSAGGSLWIDASTSGAVSFSNGQAILQTGNNIDPFSAVMVQGDDGFFSFSNPISLAGTINWLLFDVQIERIGTDSSETGSSVFSDALSANLYDSLDSSFDLVPSQSVIAATTGIGSLFYTLDVSSLQGRDIALSFELADEDDGFNSRVILDNVRFTTVVPIPSSLLMFLAGMPLLGYCRRRKKSS